MTSEGVRRRRPAGYAEVLANPEFRALFLGRALSVLGDFVARAALVITVYDRTGSTSLMALTFALASLPDLLGGPLLASMADRFPRRFVMVAADLGRAALLLVMAIPGTPLPVLLLLLVTARLLDSPFNSSHAATVSVVLDGEQFVTGTALLQLVGHLGFAVGYASGGAVVGWLGVGAVLIGNATTFGLSAALVFFGVRHRPAAAQAATEHASGWFGPLRSSVTLVARDRKLRILILFPLLIAVSMVCETLAVPYATELGAGSSVAGVLMAANCTGIVVGLWAYSRWVPPGARSRWTTPLATLTCIPLLVFAVQPGALTAGICFALAGGALCFWVPLSAQFTKRVPDSVRGQTVGLLITVMKVTQGGATILFGALAGVMAPSLVVAGAGAAGLLLTALLTVAWRRVKDAGPPDDRGPAGDQEPASKPVSTSTSGNDR